MVQEKYAVRLSSEDRDQLERLIRSGQRSARVINRVRILLKTDEGWSASQVAAAPVSSTGQALDTSPRAAFRTKPSGPYDSLRENCRTAEPQCHYTASPTRYSCQPPRFFWA